MPRRQIFVTDIIIDVAIPVFIIGLIWSMVVFAISIKGVFYPGHEWRLQIVFFLYVLGTVMINRIAGYYGESDKAAVYSVLLVGMMALFALTFSARFGSVFGGQDAGEGLWANLALVAIVGLASYKIARESCLDIKDTEKEKSAIQLRSELRAQRDWYQRMEMEEEKERKSLEKEKKETQEPSPESARPPKKHPGIWIIYFSLFSMIVFAVGQRLLPEDNWELYKYTFTCLAANLMCALALLLLISLSSLRRQCWQKKALVTPGVGWFWIMAGATLILIVVSLATVLPRPVPEYLVRSTAPTVLPKLPDEEAEEKAQSSSPTTWAGLRKQAELEAAKEEEETRKFKQQMEGADEEAQGGDETDEAEGRGRGSGGEEAGDASRGKSASGKGGSGRGSGRSKAGKTTVHSGIAKRAPLPTPPLEGLAMLGKVIFFVILAAALLWAFIMILGALGKTNPLKKLTTGLKNLRERMRNLLKGGQRPKLRGRRLETALKEQDIYMENPFRNRALLRQMSKEELVSYTYRAFENYSHAQGHTPSKGQTPIEFLKSLPDELHAAEFSTLVKLFMLAEYSSHDIADKNIEYLERAWKKIEA